MKKVSVIINGTRYDSHVEDMGGKECGTCDLQDFCDSKSLHINEACFELLGGGCNFKKSEKKFEK